MNPYNPIASYRIQFHKGFGFPELEKIIPYLGKLGVKTIYASPIFKAVAGSTHGYDVTDANQVNPEIGTLEELYNISRSLKKAGIGWIQDIVPNHMALHPDNPWIADVLQHGQHSPYARHFDIDWQHPLCPGKLMLPVLDTDLPEAIQMGRLTLSASEQGYGLSCGGSMFPVSEASLQLIERQAGDIAQVNADPSLLARIAEAQHYLLCPWHCTDHTINYRRFFTINGLIGLNIQDERVFDEYHRLIRRLCADGVFQGLRADHIDGLADPSTYLYRLRQLAGAGAYLCVEKILEPGEKLVRDWPVQGTTGYDFLGQVNKLFTAAEYQKRWDEYYRNISAQDADPEAMALEKKRTILETYMQGETDQLCRMARRDFEEAAALEEEELKKGINAFLVHCPVYKYYAGSFPLEGQDHKELSSLLDKAEQSEPAATAGINCLRSIFLGVGAHSPEEILQRTLAFYRRCMQFTGSLMAKGVEDTLMYTYNRFIAHNEVGDSPQAFGMGKERFHRLMEERQADWPLTLNATATHDTKRGEDARARLHVLPDTGRLWFALINKWMKLHEDFVQQGMPDANDRYLLYQVLVASYPPGGRIDAVYRERLNAFLVKALREAKIHSNWSQPDEVYERQTQHFLDRILDTETFVKELSGLMMLISDAAYVNALQQLLLKCTCPGVPDIYQGTELWDFSMVDPDNRRPVNYALREQQLDELLQQGAGKGLLTAAWDKREAGAIKLLLTQRLLMMRQADPKLWALGRYEALPVKGRYQKHILAFVRTYERRNAVVVIGLNSHQLAQQQSCTVSEIDWADTAVALPGTGEKDWQDILEGRSALHQQECRVTELFGPLPLALIYATASVPKRGCGILLPVFSLPSAFGIGDFGPSASRFIRFLEQAGQRYWQILPLNPVHQQQSYSPYSTVSSMALNPLFISPEALAADGLLSEADLAGHQLPPSSRIDYALCEQHKTALLDAAYQRFRRLAPGELKIACTTFYANQAWWLEDYAQFTLLTGLHQDAPWYKWPAQYRDREETALRDLNAHHALQLDRIKWIQFIADRQWRAVKMACAQAGIRVIGDLPFYLSHQSAEIWANPEIFNLTDSQQLKAVAGVPPDYFSSSGQLWNMPTYNWLVLQANGYRWWIDRLKRNIALFDLLRLDHFRAFESFWEVPAGEETAIKGRWIKGPGMDFFRQVKNVLGHLPFIAEDLGDEMEAVYAFRKQLGLPGMKVLQFAWGANMPQSVDAPHNHTPNGIVYTGTHDNNTTKGWLLEEADATAKKRLRAYTGKSINLKNINDTFLRMAYASVAGTAIVPLQDMLDLGADWRINTPGAAKGNWLIRFDGKVYTSALAGRLRLLARIYGRA